MKENMRFKGGRIHEKILPINLDRECIKTNSVLFLWLVGFTPNSNIEKIFIHL